VKVDSKIKAANDIMNSMGSKYSSSSGNANSLAGTGASSASGGKAFGFGDGTGASNSDSTNGSKDASTVGASGSQHSQTGSGSHQFGNSNDNSSSSSDEVVNDQTGMNDDEKEKLLTTVQDNKEQFQPNEEDGIFKLVSKAYVRNLDRILIRKKKIEPDGSALK